MFYLNIILEMLNYALHYILSYIIHWRSIFQFLILQIFLLGLSRRGKLLKLGFCSRVVGTLYLTLSIYSFYLAKVKEGKRNLIRTAWHQPNLQSLSFSKNQFHINLSQTFYFSHLTSTHKTSPSRLKPTLD